MSELIECIDGLTANQIFRRIAKTANGQPFYLQTQGAGGLEFCAIYQAVYDAMIAPPPDAIAEAQNTMICGLVDDGVWAKLDLFYVFANLNANDSLINWVNPGTFNCTIGANPVAHTQYEGYQGDAITGFLRTNWIASVNGINYILNSACFGCYSRTESTAWSYDMGIDSANDANIRLRTPATNCEIKVNTNTSNTNVVPSSLGLFASNRPNPGNQEIWRNGALVQSFVKASTGVPNIEMYILAQNNAGAAANFSGRQISMAFAGGALTVGEHLNLTNRFETYMDSNGKGVIL